MMPPFLGHVPKNVKPSASVSPGTIFVKVSTLLSCLPLMQPFSLVTMFRSRSSLMPSWSPRPNNTRLTRRTIQVVRKTHHFELIQEKMDRVALGALAQESQTEQGYRLHSAIDVCVVLKASNMVHQHTNRAGLPGAAIGGGKYQ